MGTRSQQVEGFLNGCPVWRGQGEGKSGAGGRTGEWELAPRPLLPAAFCHLCSQQGYSNYTLTLKMYVLSFGGKLQIRKNQFLRLDRDLLSYRNAEGRVSSGPAPCRGGGPGVAPGQLKGFWVGDEEKPVGSAGGQ